MSGAVNVRRRPSLFTYFSFTGSPSRRRSVSLPTRSAPDDPHEKADRHISNGGLNGSAGFASNGDALMTQSQRSRYLKAGGILAVLLLLFFFLAPQRDRVTHFGGGSKF